MENDNETPSRVLPLVGRFLLVANSLAAALGILLVIFIKMELAKSGEKWGLMVLPMWCGGLLLVLLPLLIATFVFVARAGDKASTPWRWTLLFMILTGVICVIAPFFPSPHW